MIYAEIVLISVLVFFFASVFVSLYSPGKKKLQKAHIAKYKDSLVELEAAFLNVKDYGYNANEMVCPHFISTQGTLMLIYLTEFDSSYIDLEGKTVRLIYNLNILLDHFIKNQNIDDNLSKAKFSEVVDKNPLIAECSKEVQECLNYISMKLNELQ